MADLRRSTIRDSFLQQLDDQDMLPITPEEEALCQGDYENFLESPEADELDELLPSETSPMRGEQTK